MGDGGGGEGGGDGGGGAAGPGRGDCSSECGVGGAEGSPLSKNKMVRVQDRIPSRKVRGLRPPVTAATRSLSRNRWLRGLRCVWRRLAGPGVDGRGRARTLEPSAGPMGGAGLAFPATMASLMYPAIFAAMLVTARDPLPFLPLDGAAATAMESPCPSPVKPREPTELPVKLELSCAAGADARTPTDPERRTPLVRTPTGAGARPAIVRDAISTKRVRRSWTRVAAHTLCRAHAGVAPATRLSRRHDTYDALATSSPFQSLQRFAPLSAQLDLEFGHPVQYRSIACPSARAPRHVEAGQGAAEGAGRPADRHGDLPVAQHGDGQP